MTPSGSDRPSGRRRRGRQTFTETARRAQIVRAALETIARHGYAQASYARIARHAGLSSTGLITYYFAGKEDLIEQVVGEVVAAGQAFMVPRMEAAAPGRARLRAYIASNVEFLDRHREHTAAVTEILNALPRDRGVQPAPYLRLHELGLRQLERYLSEGQQIGELRAFDTAVMAATIRAAIDALAHRLAAEPELDAAGWGEELAALFDHATRAAS